VHIREATGDDKEAVRRLYAEFHSFHVRAVPTRLREPESGEADSDELDRGIDLLIDSDEATLLVAEAEGRLSGFAELYLDPPNESPFVVSRCSAKLQSLLVTENARGAGLGQALIEAAEHWAAAHGAEEIKARTWEFPEGPLGFYESRGYRTLSRELVKPLPWRE
jgi:GNAT superfamily N-acetyltransferase